MTYGAKAKLNAREKVFEVLERGRRGTMSQWFDLFIISLILASVLASILQTVSYINESHGHLLQLLDRTFVAIFICEYLARLWVAPEHPLLEGYSPTMARLRLMATPMMILDFVAILPFFIEIAVGVDVTAIRVLRIVRFYRLARYAPAILTIGRVLGAEWRSLVGSAIIFTGVLLFASVAMYYAEGGIQPDKLGDIPKAMWWAVVTLSTVGYGDIVPITPVGKFIGTVVMVLGLLFFALPVGIIANGFQEEIKRRDFIVSFAMVARVPLFSGLKAPVIARLAGMLTARKFAANAIILSKGDDADEMYFIASGEVEVELPERPVRLGEGDFFGEVALIHRDTKRTATVTAVYQTDLLVLSERDFRRLMHDIPDLHNAVRETADQRMADNRRRHERGEQS
jgi:voltage-gated potassium channel